MNDIVACPTAVSVHVRRGDYASNPETNRFHGTCSLEYYSDAFAVICDRVDNPTFFVFSDDPAWTRTNIRPPGKTVYVTHNGSAAVEDMRLMSHCVHHIIANSSFSWWAAWLSSSENKIVVSPEQWLATGSAPVKDLIPKEWIRVPARHS